MPNGKLYNIYRVTIHDRIYQNKPASHACDIFMNRKVKNVVQKKPREYEGISAVFEKKFF